MADKDLEELIASDDLDSWGQAEEQERKQKRASAKKRFMERQEALGLKWANYRVPVEYEQFFRDQVIKVMEAGREEREAKRDYLKMIGGLQGDE